MEYIFIDEEGNQGVNQESFNLYDGPAVSLDDFYFQTENGIRFNADLQNITLNNRNLRASAFKSGLFGASVYNHQYRRLYDFGGGKYTRRRSTGGRAHFYPLKQVKIFGGIDLIEKSGERFMILTPINDSSLYNTDYTYIRFNVGGALNLAAGNYSFQYLRSQFSKDKQPGGERDADRFEMRGFTPIPFVEWLTFSGGYHYRRDKYEDCGVDLTTNQGWAAMRAYLPQGLIAEYRFLAARTRHDGNNIETDNFVNTVSLGKNWVNSAGVRIGYENRIQDDLTDRSVAHLLMLAGWYRFNKRFMARAGYTLRMKEITTGTVLVGDEDFTRHKISIYYAEPEWGGLSIRYQGRIRTNDDIGTRIEYQSVSTVLNIKREAYGRVTFEYAYYLGEFENRSSGFWENYEFSDHVLSGTVFSKEFRGITTSLGGSYYRSRRDRDTEKFGIRMEAGYRLPHEYRIGILYRALNFDNFLVNNEYYTGNIVNISITKVFSI